MLCLIEWEFIEFLVFHLYVCVCVCVALVAEECVRQLHMRVHSNRVSAATTSSQQDLDRALKNKREVGQNNFYLFIYFWLH